MSIINPTEFASSRTPDNITRFRVLGIRYLVFAICLGVAVGIGIFGVFEFYLHPLNSYPHTGPYWIHYGKHIGAGGLASIVVVLSALSISQRFHARRQQHIQDAYSNLNTAFDEKVHELARSQALFECLFDTMQERILVLNRQGRILLANRTAKEQAARDPEGHLIHEVFVTACAPEVERRQEANFIKYCFDSDPGRRSHCLCKRRLLRGGPDGQQLLSLDIYPIVGVKSENDLVLEVARDVTHEKEQDIQRQHQEKMSALGMLAAGVAHDLANPLASLQSELELVKIHQDTGYAESIPVIEKHLHRIDKMLREVVEFSRRRSESSSSARVYQAVTDAWRLVEHDQRARKIEVVTELDSGLPEVDLAEDDLVFILINLLINAFDAMPDGGKVWITGKLEGKNDVLLIMRDSGVGMSEEVLKQATNPMFTTKRAPHGTGLGLSVSADILHAAGGALELSSHPGEGTTVSLHLLSHKDTGIVPTDSGKKAVVHG